MQTQTKQKEQKKAEYRYFCDACTGVAFLSLGTSPKNHPANCQCCGHAVGQLKSTNFLLLSEDHPARKATATIYN